MSNKVLITSPQNPHFKRWMSLCETKGIMRHQQCLVGGEKIVRETLQHHSSLCQELLCSPKTAWQQDLPSHVQSFQLSGELLHKIDITGTSFPLLVCHLTPYASAALDTPPEGLEVLCPLGDPLNLGTVIRSCVAFAVDKLILLEEAAHPFHPKTIRASSGAVFNQLLCKGPRMSELTQYESNSWVASLDLKGENLSTWAWPKNIRLLIGEEGLGLPQGQHQQRLMIPQTKALESLNAATAMGIALFAYRQQFPLPQHA